MSEPSLSFPSPAPAITPDSLTLPPETSVLSASETISNLSLPLIPTVSLSPSSSAIDTFSPLAASSTTKARVDSFSLSTSSPAPQSQITAPLISLTSSPTTRSRIADPSTPLLPTSSRPTSSTIIQRYTASSTTEKYRPSALQPFSSHGKSSSPGKEQAFPIPKLSLVADELAALPSSPLATERSLPRSPDQSLQRSNPVVQRLVASEDVAPEDHSIRGMDAARTIESIAEFRSESLLSLSSPSNLISSTLQQSAYYGDAAASTQFSAMPNRRIVEPTLRSASWLNLPPDDYSGTFAIESISQSSISNPAVQPTQSVDRRFEALSRSGAISSSTEIASNDAFIQSGDWQFNQSLQTLNNASTISSALEQFDTALLNSSMINPPRPATLGRINTQNSPQLRNIGGDAGARSTAFISQFSNAQFDTDAQTQGIDRPIQRLIQPDTRTSPTKLNVDASNQPIDRRTQVLRKTQEDNYSVEIGFTDQVVGSEDISAKRTLTEEKLTEENLITWKPLVPLDATSPTELSNGDVPQADDRRFQQTDQGPNNFSATSLASSTADTQSQFGARPTQPLLQKQSQSNLSTALSNSASRDDLDRSPQVLPSDHINSPHTDIAAVQNPRIIHSPSPLTVGEKSPQPPPALGDLKLSRHTRKEDTAGARLAAITPQANNTTVAASRSSVTSAPTISLAVAELQAFQPDETDSGESLHEQTAIRPYQWVTSRSHSIPNPDATILDLAADQSPFTNPVNSELELLITAKLITSQNSLELEDSSVAFGDPSALQLGTSFLGLPPSPLPPSPAPASSNSAPPSPPPSPPPQPDRSPTQSKQPPTFPEPMSVIAPPRPALSLNDYLKRRRRGQR